MTPDSLLVKAWNTSNRPLGNIGGDYSGTGALAQTQGTDVLIASGTWSPGERGRFSHACVEEGLGLGFRAVGLAWLPRVHAICTCSKR